jgi:hypothetical protein
MKKTILAAVVCLGGLMTTASAQIVGELRVNLPVAASLNGVTLPAGEYTIRDLQHDVLQISAYKGKSVDAVAMEVTAPNNQAPEESKVVLKQTGEGYEIQSIWIAGEEIGYQFVK